MQLSRNTPGAVWTPQIQFILTESSVRRYTNKESFQLLQRLPSSSHLFPHPAVRQHAFHLPSGPPSLLPLPLSWGGISDVSHAWAPWQWKQWWEKYLRLPWTITPAAVHPPSFLFVARSPGRPQLRKPWSHDLGLGWFCLHPAQVGNTLEDST